MLYDSLRQLWPEIVPREVQRVIRNPYVYKLRDKFKGHLPYLLGLVLHLEQRPIVVEEVNGDFPCTDEMHM